MAHHISLRSGCIRFPDAKLYDIIQEDLDGPVFEDVEVLEITGALVIHIIGTRECYIITPKTKKHEAISKSLMYSRSIPAPVPVAPVEKRYPGQTSFDF